MASYIVCIFLLFALDRPVESAPALNLKTTEIVQPGKSVELQCEAIGYNINDHHLHWVRQYPGTAAIEWMAAFRTGYTTYIHDSFKNRVTPSTRGSVGLLTINNLVQSDTAIYYCARDRGYLDIWSQGQQVLITSAVTAKLQVFPLVAFKGTTSTTTTVGCLSYYFPPPVSSKIETSSGRQLTGVKEFKGSPNGNPSSLLSVATVSNSDWEAATYKCHVQHNSIDIVKAITNVCEVQPKEPSVRLWQGTCPENNYGEIELTCQVFNLTSPKAKVQWYINDQEKTLPEDQNDLGKTQGYFYVKSSTVTISKALWNNGVRVKCRATDLNSGKSAENTIKKCSGNFNCLGINLFIVPPSIKDIYVHNSARVRCVASNLKDIGGSSSFKWSFSGATTPLNQQTEDPQLHENGTYSLSNVLTIPPDTWKKNTEITCTYYNNNLQEPIIARIRKGEVTTQSQPVVQVIPPSDEEKNKKEMCSIVAIVSDFFPNNIYVGWRAKNVEVSKELYINSQPTLDTNRKTWTVYSKLNIPCNEWESGTSYNCVVVHESLPKNIMSKPIDKYSGKPASVVMSVTVSDTTLSCY